MKKVLTRSVVLIIILLIFAVAVTIYGKVKIKHINYENYIGKSVYAISNLEESLYQTYPELKNVIIQDKNVHTVNDLLNFSEDVLVIEVANEPIIHGNGIVNTGTIKKIIKGENVELNEKIQIYDLVLDTQSSATIYLSGATSLQVGKQYLVFLNQAPRPSILKTYVFSSAEFGHIRLNEKPLYLKDYENYSMPVKDILKYDYVFLEETYSYDDIVKYEKIVAETRELLDNYN